MLGGDFWTNFCRCLKPRVNRLCQPVVDLFTLGVAHKVEGLHSTVLILRDEEGAVVLEVTDVGKEFSAALT